MATPKRKTNGLTKAGREKIAAAQRKRWAAYRKQKKRAA